MRRLPALRRNVPAHVRRRLRVRRPDDVRGNRRELRPQPRRVLARDRVHDDGDAAHQRAGRRALRSRRVQPGDARREPRAARVRRRERNARAVRRQARRQLEHGVVPRDHGRAARVGPRGVEIGYRVLGRARNRRAPRVLPRAGGVLRLHARSYRAHEGGRARKRHRRPRGEVVDDHDAQRRPVDEARGWPDGE